MADVKKTEKSLGPAPAISCDLKVAPNEIKQDFGIQVPEGNCGYLSFGKTCLYFSCKIIYVLQPSYLVMLLRKKRLTWLLISYNLSEII